MKYLNVCYTWGTGRRGISKTEGSPRRLVTPSPRHLIHIISFFFVIHIINRIPNLSISSIGEEYYVLQKFLQQKR